MGTSHKRRLDQLFGKWHITDDDMFFFGRVKHVELCHYTWGFYITFFTTTADTIKQVRVGGGGGGGGGERTKGLASLWKRTK